MKKLFLLVLVALMALQAVAQTSSDMRVIEDNFSRSLDALFDKEARALQPDSVTPNGEWQMVMETTLKADESYKYARQVLARIVPNYQRNVKLEDEKEHKIICDIGLPMLGSFYDGATNLMRGVYEMTMTLVFKDGKYRVRCDEAKCSYKVTFMGSTLSYERGQAFRSANIKAKGSLQNDMKSKAGQFMKAFSKMLSNQKQDDDF